MTEAQPRSREKRPELIAGKPNSADALRRRLKAKSKNSFDIE